MPSSHPKVTAVTCDPRMGLMPNMEIALDAFDDGNGPPTLIIMTDAMLREMSVDIQQRWPLINPELTLTTIAGASIETFSSPTGCLQAAMVRKDYGERVLLFERNTEADES